ncbi:MAG: DUF4058 family protein [Chloroflexi bacterium]|nr:DUF4058 family protein [Chloroflexota bacterium]
MPSPFPGMDPYLEQPNLWPNVHNSLIVAIRDDLASRLRPRYYVSIEERSYLAPASDLTLFLRPDVAVVKPQPTGLNEPVAIYATTRVEPVPVTLPMPEEIRESFLEVRTVEDDRVVTVLEILSPTNKKPGKGRDLYLEKRMAVLASTAHLVEIDLLRAGEPMLMWSETEIESDYRILISPRPRRPQADLYPFGLRQPIPTFPLPLQKGDEWPLVELNRLLRELYDRAGYDLRIDYSQDPEPPLGEEDAAWARKRLEQLSRSE